MMTKAKAKALVDAIIKLRNSATDEQAVETTVLYPAWTEEVYYKIGERVLYDNVLYKVMASHTSKADYTPNVANDLYVKVLIEE